MTPAGDSPQQPPRPPGSARPAAPADPPRPDALYEQGMAFYQRREWSRALDNFRQLKAIEPNWPGLDPLIDEASWLLQLEQVDARSGQPLEQDDGDRKRRPAGALRWLALVVVVAAVLAVLAWWQGWLPSIGNRLEYEALYNRGQASLAVGDYQGAKEAFAGLAQLAPERFVSLAQEGLERAARLEQVALAYDEANDAIQAEDWDTAEARLRSVLVVDPVYADAGALLDLVLHRREVSTLFRAGVAAYDEGDYSRAIEQLERLSELDATYQRDAVRELLFVLYLRDGRALASAPNASADAIRQAIARFGKALALRPRNVEAGEERQLADRYLSARQALDQGDPLRAEDALAALLAQQPDYADGQAAALYYDLLLRRGDEARLAGDAARAARAYQQALAVAVPDKTRAEQALQQLSPTPTLTPTPVIEVASTPFVSIETDNLNVRLGPGTDYPIIGQLGAGGQLALLGRNEAGDWLVVCCVDDRPGWVAARLVNTDADIMALPVGLPPTRVPAAPPPPPTATPGPTIAAAPTPTPEPTSAPVSPPAPTEPPPTPTPPPR